MIQKDEHLEKFLEDSKLYLDNARDEVDADEKMADEVWANLLKEVDRRLFQVSL